MKREVLALALILALLFSAIAGVFFVNLAWANPWASPLYSHSILEGVIPLPEGTKLPVVTVFNPQNNTHYASKNLLLNFSVTIERSNNISLSVDELYYLASWKKDRTNINIRSYVKNNYPNYSVSINLTDVPEGPRWIQVYARSGATAYQTGYYVNGFHRTTYYVAYEALSASSKVEFTIDTIRPQIFSLLLENKTYDTSNVSLTLTTNEPVSQVLYSLDEHANVTVAGNTTLTDLSNGIHNITVYAWDTAGNVGSLETVTFTVAKPEPFPIIPVIASIAPIAIVSAGLFAYFKKRNMP